MKLAIELLERAKAESLMNGARCWNEATVHAATGNHERAGNLQQHGARCYDVAEDCAKALKILKAPR